MTRIVDGAPAVRVEGGRLGGRMDRGVAVFLGISYAAPPFGARRMLPPEPPGRREGERAATDYGPTCPQGGQAPQDAALFPEVVILGDDCLNLNVWTPDPGGSGLPVLVWIHGGMFAHGSGSAASYRGTSFARDGVVCVTINYRLAAEGFLYLGDGTANLGLLDQIAALEWVQANIAAFGGDPAKVTVAGQSAGAMSITALMAMPRARGLFRQAVTQSGAAAQTLTADTALGVGSMLAKSLGVTPTREALSEVPVERLARAASTILEELQADPDPARWGRLAPGILPFGPVIDGDTLPVHPLDALAGGAAPGVRLLTGSNREELRQVFVPAGTIDAVDEPALAAAAGAYGAPDGTVELYRAARPGAGSGDLLAAVLTDCFIRVPAIRVAEARVAAGEAGTWMYRFDHRSPSFGGRLGAAHAVEIPYVFDLLDDESGRALIGDAPPQAVADTAHSAWVRFAADGDPGWPRYNLADRSTALIDEELTVADDPDGAERAVWAGRL
jgi:para-nitrobenzyl esterase